MSATVSSALECRSWTQEIDRFMADASEPA
jgi:hypothetical protein